MTTATASDNKSVTHKGREKIQGQPVKDDPWGRVKSADGDLQTPSLSKWLSEHPGAQYLGCETFTTVKVQEGRFQTEQLYDSHKGYAHSNTVSVLPDSKRLNLIEYARLPAPPQAESARDLPPALHKPHDSIWQFKNGADGNDIGFVLSPAALKRCRKSGLLTPAGIRLYVTSPETVKLAARIKKEAEGDEDEADPQS
jgi:hypothetical protein